MNKCPCYFICSPNERPFVLKIGCVCVIFALIASGIFAGACYWVRSQVSGATIHLEDTHVRQP